MKKYIGTKNVEAEPMSLHKFIEETGRNPYKDNRADEDGYESWSPKEAFDKAYKVADTFIDRLHIEMKDLEEKFEKCAQFVDSSKFREVVKEDYPAFLLSLQRDVMGRYLQILACRINIADKITCEVSIKRMSFGVAIQALKFGLAVRRTVWNGKGLFVVKQIPAHITEEIIPKMQSLPQSAKDLVMKGKKFIDYTSQCLIINENTGKADSWVPSISDVFAEDWEIVKP